MSRAVDPTTEPDRPMEPAIRWWLDLEAARAGGVPDDQLPDGGLRLVHSVQAESEPASAELPEWVDGPVVTFSRRGDGRYAIRNVGVHPSASWLQHAPAVWSEEFGAWIVEPEHARSVLNLVESLNRSSAAS